MGAAPTGSGKTACFVLGILHHLSLDPYGIFALVLTPTRYVHTATVHICLCTLLLRSSVENGVLHCMVLMFVVGPLVIGFVVAESLPFKSRINLKCLAVQ
jgi:hypothetical protein